MPILPTLLLVLLCGGVSGADRPPVNPVDRGFITTPVHTWNFDRGADGWAAEHECTLSSEDGKLVVCSTGTDPYLAAPVDLPGGDCLLKIKARSATGGGGQIFWTTDRSPNRSEKQSARFKIDHDNQWHEYAIRFRAPGRLKNLRLDPGAAKGTFEIDSIELSLAEPHPLTIERIDVRKDRVRATVKNHRKAPLEFAAFGKDHTIPGEATLQIERRAAPARPIEAVVIELTPNDRRLPPVRRAVFIHHPEARTEWITRPLGDATVRIARDGTVARIERDGRLVAFLGPIVHVDGHLPKLKLTDDGPVLRFQGEGISVAVKTAGDEVSVSIDSKRPCEGPVVRVVGPVEQGLFAGLEYLGKGERSSTKLDIITEGYLRFAPDPMKVTMPLMAIRTDRATVAMTWSDMTLQPVFAVPNFFDCTDDSRMALRGTKIDAAVRVGSHTLEDDILWAVNKKGLPPLPKPPRTPRQQRDICIKTLNGPIKSDEGWGHCAEKRWARHPYAGIASTVWRLTGEVPDFPRFVPGGGTHVPNGTIFFVTGKAPQWLDHKRREAAQLIARQKPDGSYRYDGKYRKGHFEDTASGVCARPAATLLEFAYVTGDREALEAGLRTLEYMKRFRTPRGAQVWEIPLHTPDILASAYATWAYTRGYELTGNKEYLALAKRWAATGIPFVYLWTCRPVMLYATTPVWGATNWVSPNWMGLPVQWCGYVYAYALTKLAPHDDTFDWNHLARGILISAEQQQYPDGESIGLLPDAFELKGQQRRPARINPCVLVALRQVLDGQIDFLQVATAGTHRVAAPFPVTIREGAAHIRAQKGLKYQILVNGRVVDVNSQGTDVVPLK